MRIVSWNMNYWQNTKGKMESVTEWKNKCIEYLKNEKDVDFFILQEINPFKLFEKLPNQYFFSMSDYNILYNELRSELLFDGRRDNFWGNAILFNKNYEVVKNNMEIDLDLSHKNYYGRNGIMCYDFKSPNGQTISIANIYSKINYANKGRYTSLENFKEDNDIQNVIKRNSDFILAGDFNSDKEKDPSSRKFFDFIEEIGFEEYTNGEEFKNTMVPEVRPYPNDKIYIKNMKNVKKISCKLLKDTNIKLSDHYPILCEIVEE